MRSLRPQPDGGCKRNYIMALDIGTTTVRACLFDEQCCLIEHTEKPVEVEYSGKSADGIRAEINPHKLWEKICCLIRILLEQIDIANSTVNLGICCQRNSFICWNKETGIPCHKFVTWKDCRARRACKQWNESFRLKAINILGGFLYFFTRMARFKAARIFAFINAMVTHRLMVTLAENEEMQLLLREGKLCYGCLDTWLIYKLSGGKRCITEPSNASSTGLFDPYMMDWGFIILSIISFPLSLLPSHTYTAGLYHAEVDENLFGVPIKVAALTGDQQAALFACGCWRKGDISISLGTGSFVDVNTGKNVHSSIKGLYPLVGWKFPNFLSFIAEGCSQDTALILNWAHSIGLYEDVCETSEMAERCDSSGLFFVPAFCGIQTPINDDGACCGFLGLQPDTSREQMVRAILQSLAFRIYQIWKTVNVEIDLASTPFVRCCGGVSSNDFVCQTISTLINMPLERIYERNFASAYGTAMMAGITVGLWNRDDLPELVSVETIFKPDIDAREDLLCVFANWESAMQRCLHFYDEQ